MTVRALRLPQDLVPATDMLVRTFQYPDHPEWGVQSDEQEQLLDVIRRIRRMWPVVRLLQCVSPALRDLMRGFVWEEDGALRGMTMAQREGTTPMWYIGTVGVLPESRRRGVARQLLVATLDMMRSSGGTMVRLGVIGGNSPAQSLYRSLGFIEYGGSTRYSLTPAGGIDRLPQPTGYDEEPLAEFDWRTRYEVDKRIVPASLQEFEPIIRGRYRTPWLVRIVAPLFETTRDRDVIIQRTRDHVIVARFGWSVSKKGKGTDFIRVRIDPAHTNLAPYLVRRALVEVLAKSPNLRVETFLSDWMPFVAHEVEALGFVRRTSHKSMGMKL
ncbi:MAG: GNAT family N-acetyltransferase [Candidatus Bipolaricaulota bacterium]|nr:GNAT family N-acetyltransferase [Candidatus Bipolaricaulota bacterium]